MPSLPRPLPPRRPAVAACKNGIPEQLSYRNPRAHMLNLKSPLTLPALALALLFAACASTERSTLTDRHLYLDKADTLQIVFRYSADPQMQMASPTLANETESQRYRDYREVITPLLEEVGLPMRYRILEPGESPEEGNPSLELDALRWELTNYGEILITLSANLVSYGERNKLGTFAHREPTAMPLPHDLHEKQFQTILRQSLAQVLFELEKHFEGPSETKDPASTF